MTNPWTQTKYPAHQWWLVEKNRSTVTACVGHHQDGTGIYRTMSYAEFFQETGRQAEHEPIKE